MVSFSKTFLFSVLLLSILYYLAFIYVPDPIDRDVVRDISYNKKIVTVRNPSEEMKKILADFGYVAYPALNRDDNKIKAFVQKKALTTQEDSADSPILKPLNAGEIFYVK